MVIYEYFLFTKISGSKLHGWRRQWHATPVLLPGESQGRRSLVGCHLQGHTESNTTEATQQQQQQQAAWHLIENNCTERGMQECFGSNWLMNQLIISISPITHKHDQEKLVRKIMNFTSNESLCCCSVAKSCPTLCNPLDCGRPDFPVFHYLQEFAQIHVHGVNNAI